MTRIGLTQRVEVIEEYGEIRDCLDQEWTTLLSEYDIIPLPNRVNDVEGYLDSLNLDGLILTSGNDLASLDEPDDPAPERDRFERHALEYAIARDIPVLGVCRGLELLTVHFGGSLSPVSDHVANNHPVDFVSFFESQPIGVPERVTVNSYHDYGIKPDDVPKSLEILGQSPDGTVECVRHKTHTVWGIMWHPERESPSEQLDRQLITHLFPTKER